MEEIIRIINEGRSKMADNEFIHCLNSDTLPFEEKMNCVPAMAFFVMGFKDLMRIIRYQNPKNDFEKAINRHSEEDGNHWEWFLQDIQKLKLRNMGGINGVETLETLWDDDFIPVRDTLYKVAHFIHKYPYAEYRLLMIEVLEISHEVWAVHMSKQVQKAGLYEQLSYFGRRHQDAEHSHEMKEYFDNVEDLKEVMGNFTIPQLEEAKYVANELVEGMNNVLTSFAKYVTKKVTN
jgi:hypothetical protein